jgi:DNA-binding NtrC family response regulator
MRRNTAPKDVTMDRRRLRVLCVDDHDDTRDVLRRLLVLNGYAVRTCATVAEAHAALFADGAGRYDVLICELRLPDGDGCELMLEVSRRLGIPGVSLGATTSEAEHARSRDAGFAEHLDAPVGYDQLIATIRRITSGRERR